MLTLKLTTSYSDYYNHNYSFNMQLFESWRNHFEKDQIKIIKKENKKEILNYTNTQFNNPEINPLYLIKLGKITVGSHRLQSMEVRNGTLMLGFLGLSGLCAIDSVIFKPHQGNGYYIESLYMLPKLIGVEMYSYFNPLEKLKVAKWLFDRDMNRTSILTNQTILWTDSYTASQILYNPI